MFYIVHNNDTETLEEKIIPLFKQEPTEIISYHDTDNLNCKEDDIIVTYLPDYLLRDFIPKAAENKWVIGILPHPEMDYITKGLGISDELNAAVEEICDHKENHKVDLLFCNNIPVFQSVNLGSVFELIGSDSIKNFYSQTFNIIKRIWQIRSLRHRAFNISIDDEKIIDTSALGIIAVEHGHSSVISKRLVPDSSINDGLLHVLILSPQNIFEVIRFLLRSLLPKKEAIRKLPSFIGYIKSSSLQIKSKSEINFTIDGEQHNSNEINFEIKHEALLLTQASLYEKSNKGTSEKKDLKISKLPKGEKRDELVSRKLTLLPRATSEEFQDLFKILRENAFLTTPYIIMMILSTLIATFGLYADSSPVIIGAMILAPLMSPIVSFSMGVVRYDVNMLKNGFTTILIGTLVSLFFAAFVSIITPLKVLTPEISSRLSPSLLDLGIAVASGIAAAYAHSKESIAKSLAGVAIAVALVPPLAVAGIGIGWMDWDVFSGAFLLYLTNLAGIIMFAGLTFLILGFAPFKRAKRGLIYTLVIILLVCIPLTFSFNSIMQEANIKQLLEGHKFENIVIRDVNVRFGSPLLVSAKITSSESISAQRVREVKVKIEELIGKPIKLEVVTAIEF